MGAAPSSRNTAQALGCGGSAVAVCLSPPPPSASSQRQPPKQLGCLQPSPRCSFLGAPGEAFRRVVSACSPHTEHSRRCWDAACPACPVSPGVWSPVLRTHGIPPERGCSETHGAVQGAEEQSVTVRTHRFCSAVVGHGQGVTEVTTGCQGQRKGSEPLQWWVSPGAARAAGSAQVRNLAAWLCLWASAG